MKTFKVTFAKNEIISCKEIKNSLSVKGVFHYEHNNGNLIYATIKNKNEDNALTIAQLIIKEAKEQAF